MPLLAITLFGTSISGRELAIVAAVVAIVVVLVAVAVVRRRRQG
jgi:hypothetical protein